MMTSLSYITALIFLLIAFIHFLWGIDVYWPASDEASLARAVVGAKGITQMPNIWACLFVTAALLISTVIVLRLGRVIDVKFLPLWLFQLAGFGLALVFLARGIVGFTPFWQSITPEDPFLTLNRWFYSPLCVALGLAVSTLLIHSKFFSRPL
jgi:hypothetical protein